MKNVKSKLFGVLQAFNYNHCVFLSGTPIQNDMKELWAILNFLMKDKCRNLSAEIVIRWVRLTLRRVTRFVHQSMIAKHSKPNTT
jgi:SNF2 family DNA or RNA helicase